MNRQINTAIAALERELTSDFQISGQSETQPTASNAHINTASPETINKIRDKIKAARLEKLMARQLASELQSQQQQDFTVEMIEKPANNTEPAPMSAENEALLNSIDETSQSLNQFVSDLDASTTRNDDQNEAFGIIENQNRQIKLLEFLRNKEADQSKKLGVALGQFQELVKAQSEALTRSRAEANALKDEIKSLNQQNLLEKNQLQESKIKDLEANLEEHNLHTERMQNEQEKLEKELATANKLVTLQDEMITALTTPDLGHLEVQK